MSRIKKVLILNKFHFVSGGAERYFLSLKDLLRRNGVEAIPLSVNYAPTLDDPYRRYFPEPVSAGDHKILKRRLSPAAQWKTARAAVYNAAAKRAARAVVRDHRPDVAYVLNINNHLSPSVVDACREEGVPVVMRMSDYNLVCSSNMYFRDGRPCMDCKRGFHHALLHRCVDGSAAKTAAAVFAKTVHRWRHIYEKVSAFVTPSLFMKKELEAIGFSPAIVHQINTFVEREGEPGEPDGGDPHVLFVGRFAAYKGADLAIRAFTAARKPAGVSLRLIGDEDDADSRSLKRLAADLGADVRFMPFERDKKGVIAAIHRALFTVAPSKFYENLPNAVLEAFACGRTVIAARIGSIPETIRHGEDGLLFEPGDIGEFARHMEFLLGNPQSCRRMGEEARRKVLAEYSEERHLERLLGLFESVAAAKEAAA